MDTTTQKRGVQQSTFLGTGKLTIAYTLGFELLEARYQCWCTGLGPTKHVSLLGLYPKNHWQLDPNFILPKGTRLVVPMASIGYKCNYNNNNNNNIFNVTCTVILLEQ